MLESIPPELCEAKEVLPISSSEHDYPKTLGMKWSTVSDSFFIDVVSAPPDPGYITKRTLASDIAKVFDVFGWIHWDDRVPEDIYDKWELSCHH